MTGFASERVEELVPELEKRHGVRDRPVHNDHAEEWNNAYSLWLARRHSPTGRCWSTATPFTGRAWRTTCSPRAGAGVLLAVDTAKPLGEEEMKVVLDEDGAAGPDQQAGGPGRGGRRVHRRRPDRAVAAAVPLADALEATWRRDPACTTRTASRSSSTVAGTVRAAPIGDGDGSRSTTTPTWPGPGDRVPLLARMIASPARVDVRHGAVGGAAPTSSPTGASRPAATSLSWSARARARKSSRSCRPALEQRRRLPGRAAGPWLRRSELADGLRAGSYDAVVGIGGGRTLDVAKYAATRRACRWSRWRRTSPTTASPRRSPRSRTRRAQGVLRRADPDRGRRRPRLRAALARGAAPRPGIGDALSNLSALADWELAAEDRGEPVDGLAASFARAGAESFSTAPSDDLGYGFLSPALAEALVLSGLAMAVAGSSRPCSGAATRSRTRSTRSSRTASHGEQVAVGRALRLVPAGGRALRARSMPPCAGTASPACPPTWGSTKTQFAAAVARPRPRRPDRYTILEHLELDEDEIRERVGAMSMPSIAELRAETQPTGCFARPGAEHWAGRLYMRRLSPYLTRLHPSNAACPRTG